MSEHRISIEFTADQWSAILEALDFQAADDPLGLEGGFRASQIAAMLRGSLDAERKDDEA